MATTIFRKLSNFSKRSRKSEAVKTLAACSLLGWILSGLPVLANSDLSKNYNNQGCEAMMNKDYAKAESLFKSAMIEAEKVSDTRRGITAANNLAAVRRAQGDEAGANRYAAKAKMLQAKVEQAASFQNSVKMGPSPYPSYAMPSNSYGSSSSGNSYSGGSSGWDGDSNPSPSSSWGSSSSGTDSDWGRGYYGGSPSSPSSSSVSSSSDWSSSPSSTSSTPKPSSAGTKSALDLMNQGGLSTQSASQALKSAGSGTTVTGQMKK